MAHVSCHQGLEALPPVRPLASAVWSRAEAAPPACAAVCTRAHASGGAGQTLGVCHAVGLPHVRHPHVAPRLQVVESSLKHSHARMLAQMLPKLRAKHAAKVSSRRYKVGTSAGNVLAWPGLQAVPSGLQCGLLVCAGRLVASVRRLPWSGVSSNRCRGNTDDHALHRSRYALPGSSCHRLAVRPAGSPDLRHVTSGGVSPLPDCARRAESPLLCGLQVSPDLYRDTGAIHAAIRAYRPHLARCTNPTAAASGHPARSAPATAAAPSCRTPSPEQDAGPPPGLQSERGSLDEPSFSAAAGHAAGQRPQVLHSTARVNLDSHFGAAAAAATCREQQAPLTPVEPKSEAPPPTSSAGSSPGHGTSQLEVQRKSPLPPTPTPTCPAVPTNSAAQAQAETPAITALTHGPAQRSAGGQAAACPPGPEPRTSQPRKGRARRW